MKTFSVVIPTFNRKEILEKVLLEFNLQDYPKDSFEVVVVDSSSTDGTEDLLSNFNANFNFKYIIQPDKGRGGARNTGVKVAQGEYILFTDADILPSTTLIKEHSVAHNIYPASAIVGWEVRVDSFEEYKKVLSRPPLRREFHSPFRKRLSWLFFLTGNASVKKEFIMKAGGFDEEFKGYGWEDVELGYRLSRAGIPIYYWRRAINFHLHPVSWQEKLMIRKMAGNSLYYFYKKHKDKKILYLLGINPVTLLGEKLLTNLPSLKNYFHKVASGDGIYNSIIKEILLNYYYLQGFREATCFLCRESRQRNF